MKFRNCLVAALAVTATTLISVDASRAAVFSFTFSSDGSSSGSFFPPGSTNSPGSVSGLIYGLSENGLGQQATSIVITHSDIGGVGTTYPGFLIGGLFDVVNGHIVANKYGGIVELDATGSTPDYRNTSLVIDYSNQGLNYFEVARPNAQSFADYDRIWNFGGFNAVTFAEVSAVPEPSTWAMLLMGFAGLATLYRRRDRAALQN